MRQKTILTSVGVILILSTAWAADLDNSPSPGKKGNASSWSGKGTLSSDQEAFERGMKAYKSGNYGTAFETLLPLAQRGMAIAQDYVGLMYYEGQGVIRDYGKAAQWCQKAADQGNVAAMVNLGIFYRDGKGVPRDYVKAREYFRMAGMRNDPDAQNNLGAMLANGQGGPKDLVEAYAWLSLADDLKQPTAKSNLEAVRKMMTQKQIGDGEFRSLELTVDIENLHKKGKEGSTGSWRYIPTADDEKLLKQGTIAYANKDYITSMQLLKPLAEKGMARAQAYVGTMYHEGEGVKKNTGTARTWYEKAMAQSDLLGINNLAILYRDGSTAVPQDYGKARELFLRGARQGYDQSENNLGAMYTNSQGGPQDLVEGYAWITLAADQGMPLAKSNVSSVGKLMTEDQLRAANRRAEELRRQIQEAKSKGKEGSTRYPSRYISSADDEKLLKQGTIAYANKDYVSSMQILQPLAEKGMARAQAYVGTMYHEGEGVKKNTGTARTWYEKAVAQGDVLGINNLAILYRDGSKDVPQDYGKARKLFLRAALQGYDQSENNLGAMYTNSQGGPQDLVEGYAWITLAADQGMPLAKSNVSSVGKLMTEDQLRAANRRTDEIRRQIQETKDRGK